MLVYFFNDRNNAGKTQKFIRLTKANSPTPKSGATSLPPIGDSFMYIETSSNNQGENVFCCFERIDIIQISNISFYFNRFSTSDVKAMGRFRIQLLLGDNTRSNRYNISKDDRYSDTSTTSTLINLTSTVENYGIRFIYGEIDSAVCDMCFINITITHSVY